MLAKLNVHVCLVVFSLWMGCACVAAADEVLFEDGFEFLELDETWQEHGAGFPDVALDVIFVEDSEVLQMITSGSSDEFFGIETINPISIAGLSDLTIDVRLRPINQGVEGSIAAAELALLGSSGDYMRLYASNNAGPDPDAANDWADGYEDSLGTVLSSGAWPHCDAACDAMRNFVVVIDSSGTTIRAFDDLDDPDFPTWEAFSDFTLADLGPSVTIALRQLAVDGGDSVAGFFDEVRVTTTGGAGLLGDFDGNGVLGTEDINALVAQPTAGTHDPRYDVTGDGVVDGADVVHWVKELKRTWMGDANLDGEFNSADFVAVFQPGKFEQNEDAVWTEGDWTGDLRFSSADFVAAFQDGGFEQGPRTAVSSVPEPASLLLLGLAILTLSAHRPPRMRHHA